MTRRRFDILDAWRSLAVLLMVIYHFLFDLYLFGVMTAEQLFSTPMNILERFICTSFILLAGASARFSRNNLRRGLIVLAAGLVTELGAAMAGQTIRWGVLMLLGLSMVIWHFCGKYLLKIRPMVLGWAGLALFFATRAWCEMVLVPVRWLYPLGFMYPGFYSSDYFPLFPWFFMFLLGTVLGGWCLDNQECRLLTWSLPNAVTWLGRHSLLVYLLHQPVLYGISYLIWG